MSLAGLVGVLHRVPEVRMCEPFIFVVVHVQFFYFFHFLLTNRSKLSFP